MKSNIEALRSYFNTHETKDIKFRRKKLKALKKSIQKHEAEILDALNHDLGKGKVEAYASEVGIILKSLSLFIKEMKNWNKVKTINTPMLQFPGKSYLMHEPYGVVLIIGPFNYPFQLVMEPLIGAIAAGNTAVVKPSELTPETSLVIEKILNEVFDNEYVSVFQGEKEVTEGLLKEKFDFIFFTGSPQTGKIIYEAAAKYLTPVALELGGKSPVIIDETANIKTAAERIAFGKFMNAGQTCVAPDYIIIHHSMKEKFIKAMKSTLKDFYGADAQLSEDYGSIVNDNHFNRIAKLLEEVEHKVVIGGATDAGKLYIEPTLIDNVTLDDAIMKEEIFGPLLPMMTYQTFDEVYAVINQFDKPLSLYIFSEDDETVKDVLKKVSFGGGCVNDTLMHVSNPYLPFGGVGNSGIGAYHGKYSFELFSHQKSYMTKSTKLETGLMFPPYKGKFRYIKQIFK